MNRSRTSNRKAVRPGRLIILSSPSGTGKTTVYKKLLEEIRGLKYSVSFTTRKRRMGEKDGKDYHFVTVPEFRRMVKRRDFLEWEVVYGNYYGTSRHIIDRILEKGHDCIMDVDVKGGRHLKRVKPEAIAIFLMPPLPAGAQKEAFQQGHGRPCHHQMQAQDGFQGVEIP